MQIRPTQLKALVLAIGIVSCATGSLVARVPAQQALPAGPIRLSGGVAATNLLTQVPPVYPPDAKANRVQGAVVLHAIIGANGSVQHLDVVSGPEALRASALDAVRQWQYSPYLLNGRPVAVDTTITVNFSLAD